MECFNCCKLNQPFHSQLTLTHSLTLSNNILLSKCSISWEYNPDTQIISVDQYEESRPQRRTYFEMILPRSVRQQMLRKDWDVTQAQIAAAVRQNIKVKNQRRATVNNLGKTTKMEEMMERASKGIMKGLLLKNSTKKEVEKLEKQLDEAEKLRKQQTMVHSMKDEVNEVSVDEDEVDTEELDDEKIEEYPEEEEEEESSETQDEDGENKSPTHQEKAPIEWTAAQVELLCGILVVSTKKFWT